MPVGAALRGRPPSEALGALLHSRATARVTAPGYCPELLSEKL